MSYTETYLIGASIVVFAMIMLWIISLIIENSSIIDFFWGLGFVIFTWYFVLIAGKLNVPANQILLAMVTIWGLRLSIHIFIRNYGKGEDFRYRKWREENGKRWWYISLFKVFLLQAFILLLIASPLAFSAYNAVNPDISIIFYIGVAMWGIGFVFESVGDYQLKKFKSSPQNRGKILNTGLWHYTRHPNYFGDATIWWGYYLFALSRGGWWTIYSPIVMSFFLIKVSGVSMLEKTLRQTKPGYEEYIKNTNGFFPWFKRKNQ
jgi:steroid 5-alpha reductase family enzyme